jgi:hypothetical protein
MRRSPVSPSSQVPQPESRQAVHGSHPVSRSGSEWDQIGDLPGADGANNLRSTLITGNGDKHRGIDRSQNDATSDRALAYFDRADPRWALLGGAFSAPSSQRLLLANLTTSRRNNTDQETEKTQVGTAHASTP